VLWVIRDCLSGEVLLARSLLSGTAGHGDSVLELLHISRQKFDRLIRSNACILIADEICWRWSWQAWHAWCANLSGIL
jgi:hypothetical protein